MKNFCIIFVILTVTACSTLKFYSNNKERGISEFRIGSIKTEIECTVIGNKYLTVNRVALDTINYKHMVYTRYVDSIMHIKSIEYTFIIPSTNDTLAPDTITNSLSFGERPRDAFILKHPLGEKIELYVKYKIDSAGIEKVREKKILLQLRREFYSGKGIGGC